jgi:hypothetical protein
VDDDDDHGTIADGEAPRVWVQYVSEDGDYYYENTESGVVTWLAPVDERFIPWSNLRKSETKEVA